MVDERKFGLSNKKQTVTTKYNVAYIVAFEIYCVLKSIINGVKAMKITLGVLTAQPSMYKNCTLIIKSVNVAML